MFSENFIMENQSKPIIDLVNLTALFSDRNPLLKVIEKISFKVMPHEFVSIIGPSGCGKSTLFNIIADLIDSATVKVEGNIWVMSSTPGKARTSRKVGVVFQKPTLLAWRNIEKNVSLPLEIMGVPKEIVNKRLNHLLKLVAMDDYRKFYPDEISGGMQQKTAIARALAYNPAILLMDEPFGALDEITREKMNRELVSVWRETRKTILFVTHSINEAVYLSNRIIILSSLPARVIKEIKIDLPYPRDQFKEKKVFYDYVIKVRHYLKNE